MTTPSNNPRNRQDDRPAERRTPDQSQPTRTWRTSTLVATTLIGGIGIAALGLSAIVRYSGLTPENRTGEWIMNDQPRQENAAASDKAKTESESEPTTSGSTTPSTTATPSTTTPSTAGSPAASPPAEPKSANADATRSEVDAAPKAKTAKTPKAPKASSPGTAHVSSSTPVREILIVEPPYPPIAKSARLQGSVDVMVRVDRKGVPTSVSATNGPSVLQHAAEIAAAEWRFRPATRDGKAVPATFNIRFDFKLQPDRNSVVTS